MISKKINYILQSKVSDSFLKVEYNKTNTFLARDLKSININLQQVDQDENIIVIQYFERHRSIRNFSKINVFIRNKLDKENKIPITNQPLVLNEYFDAYELIIEPAKNRLKTLNFIKLRCNIKEGINEEVDNKIIKKEDIPYHPKEIMESSLIFEKIHQVFSQSANNSNENNLVHKSKCNDKYDILKTLPVNCNLDSDEIKQEEEFDNKEINDTFNNLGALDRTNNNNQNEHSINNLTKINNTINDQIFFYDKITNDIKNNEIQNKYLIDLNPNFNMDENRLEKIKFNSTIKEIDSRINLKPLKNNKVIVDDLEAYENSLINTSEKEFKYFNQSNLDNRKNKNYNSNCNDNIVNYNSKRKNSYLLEKENKNEMYYYSNEDKLTRRNSYDLISNNRKNLSLNNRNNLIFDKYQEQESLNENPLEQKCGWSSNNNISSLKENNIRIKRSKILSGIEINENYLNQNDRKINLHNKNIVRKTINSNQNLSSLNLLNLQNNNIPKDKKNNEIKNSFLEGISNSIILRDANIIPNSGGKRLRGSIRNELEAINDKSLENVISQDNKIDFEKQKKNIVNINKNISNSNNNMNLASDFLFQSEFKTKKLKKNKSRELELPLSALCPICYDSINSLANLDKCTHDFCKNCILEWSKKTNLCPMCKKEFKKITYFEKGKKKEYKVKRRRLEIEDVMEESDFNELIEQPFLDQSCQICNRNSDEDNLLICDGCGANVCHTYCDGLESVPEGNWYCLICRNTIQNNIINIDENRLNNNYHNPNNFCERNNSRRNSNRNNNFSINENIRNNRNNNSERINNSYNDNSTNSNINRRRKNHNIINSRNVRRPRTNKNTESDYNEEDSDKDFEEDESYNEQSDFIDYSAEEEEIKEDSFVEEDEEEEDFYIDSRRSNKRNNNKATRTPKRKKNLKRNDKRIQKNKSNKNNRSMSSRASNLRGSNNIKSNSISTEKSDIFDELEKLDDFNYEDDARLEKLKRNFNLNKFKMKDFNVLKDSENFNHGKASKNNIIEDFNNQKEFNDIQDSFKKKYLEKIITNDKNNFKVAFNNTKDLNNVTNTNSYNQEFQSIKNKLRDNKLLTDDFDKYAYEEEKNTETINFSEIFNNKKKVDKIISKEEKNLSFIKQENFEESKSIDNSINEKIFYNNSTNNIEIINNSQNTIMNFEKLEEKKSKYASDSEEEDYLEEYSKQKLNKK